jgi:hypothetical protein
MVKQQTSAELVDRITFLLHIQEVLGSSISPETGHPDKEFFYRFLQSLPANGRTVLQSIPSLLSSTFLPIHYSLIFL